MLDILTTFMSILISATPFLVLGTLLAILVQRKKIFDKLIKHLPHNKFARRIIFSFTGIVLPVCECGNIPLARSLMRKGLSTGEATTFLMAAPILNPITILTTYEAFRSIPWIMPARIVGALCVALIVGEVIARLGNKSLTPNFNRSCKIGHGGHANDITFSVAFSKEFFNMFKLLIIGAGIAAVTQYVLSQQFFAGVGENYFLGVLIMLVLGFVISICSNVDAFFALGYAGTFRYGALLTFMIAGPMIDIKIVAMLKNTYTKRALIIIIALVAVLASAIGLGASYVG